MAGLMIGGLATFAVVMLLLYTGMVHLDLPEKPNVTGPPPELPFTAQVSETSTTYHKTLTDGTLIGLIWNPAGKGFGGVTVSVTTSAIHARDILFAGTMHLGGFAFTVKDLSPTEVFIEVSK